MRQATCVVKTMAEGMFGTVHAFCRDREGNFSLRRQGRKGWALMTRAIFSVG
jgi:hypothetical protein